MAPSRKDIISKGHKHRANLDKINKVLAKFNHEQMTNDECWNYLYGENFSLKSPSPDLSFFNINTYIIWGMSREFIFILLFGFISFLLLVFNSHETTNVVLGVIFAILSIVLIPIYSKQKYKLDMYNYVFTRYNKTKSNKLWKEKRRQKEALRKQQEEFERKRRNEISYWYSLSGWDFEKSVAKLFSQLGYRTKVTKGSGDGGVDIIMYKNNLKYIVQCKLYRGHKATPQEVRALWGVKDEFNADKVILIATDGVSQKSMEYIDKRPDYELLTIDDIIRLNMSINT